MPRPAVKLHIVACVVFLQTFIGVQYAGAYTLADWMRTWPNYNGPNLPAAPAALPATPPMSPMPMIGTPPNITIPPRATPPPTATTPSTNYAGTATAPYPSAATTSSASPVYVPAPTTTRRTWCDWLFCRRPVGYRPEVRYRTRLMQVPTTNYRPVTTYDPMTGTAMTNVQPCTTYSWQFRRVPYTTYRPVYSPATTLWGAPGSSPVTGYYPGTVVSGASTTCAPPAATPYYTPPQAPPASSPPSASSPPPAFPPPALPTTPQSNTPADQQSLIDLSPLLNGQPGSSTRNYPPLESSGESSDAASGDLKKGAEQPAGEILKVVPVPDPDAGRKQVPAAPSLFDPNDRTANRSTRPAWAYSTIAWPDKPKENTQQKTPTRVTKQEAGEKEEEPDSSGWHAVRP